jgi:hypothetical protein
MAPHEKKPLIRARTVVERFNSQLKEEVGAGAVMVRDKGTTGFISCLVFIALFTDQLLKLIIPKYINQIAP